MKSTVWAIIAVVVLFVGGWFYFHRGPDVRNYPAAGNGLIVAFGDSLVAGSGATQGDDFVTDLSKKLGETIVNLGVPGDTTADGLARIDDVTKLHPRLTLVLLGGNDFLQKVPRDVTFSNLRAIISRLQEAGSMVILLGVRGGLITDDVESYYSGLAKETRSAYVSDVLGGLFADSRFMADSVHPNDEGYARIANRIYPVIVSLLK